MITESELSRRHMILSSGILVAGLAQGKAANGQQAVSTDEKDLVFRTTNPRNAEPELNNLIQSWITPTKYFYVRSHAPNPQIDEASFRLSVEGLVDRPQTFSVADLREFPEHTLTATLTCAGNRRAEYNAQAGYRGARVGGVQWQAGAIGNATWTGVALADVLRRAGVQNGAAHVWFEGLDEIASQGETIAFGGSIPIQKARPEPRDEIGALLAYGMNGQPLTADHGFPLRTVVPGYIGARSVKWLGRIVVSDRTSPNHYLANAYKLVQQADPLDWSEAGPIYRYLINAAMCLPEGGTELKPGQVELAGYVLPSGILGTRVSHVYVSADSGNSWLEAERTGNHEEYCWQLWQAKVEVTDNTEELIVRATDSSGGFMPARVPWNAKGYLQNAWYRLPVTVN